jgi:hypothetical protein
MTARDPDEISLIIAYFDDLDRKIDVLSRLAAHGFENEALTLCLVYIDGLAQALCWPDERNGVNYVRALCEYSGDVELGLVHPLQLARALEAMKHTWHPTAAAVRVAFPGPSYELCEVAAVLDTLDGPLTGAQLTALATELWRGTIAAVAYYRMRNPAVHHLGAATISFGGTTLSGEPARPLDLARLQAAAKRLAAEAKRRSLEAGEWFGNDLVVS